MAAIEYRLISEVLRSRILQFAISGGLKPQHFKDPEARRIYQYILEYHSNNRTYGKVPDIETMTRMFPSFELTADEKTGGDVTALVEEIRTRALASDLLMANNMFNDLLESGGSPREILEEIRGTFMGLNTNHSDSSSFGMAEVAQGVREAYQGAKDGSLHGIPWPWDPLNEDTLGKHNGDFLVFYGRMKSMKTWLLLHCFVVDYLNGRRPMFWSREMNDKKLQLRIGSLYTGVDYQLLKKGTLPPPIYRKAQHKLDEVAHMLTAEYRKDAMRRRLIKANDMIVLAGRNAPRSISELKAAVEQYKPDILYVDSFYHLSTDRAKEGSARWIKITMLAEDLKQLAMDDDIPVLATTQANREGEKGQGKDLTEVAGADAIAQEADLIMRVIRKRRGRELFEDEYEGYWKRKQEKKAAPKSRKRVPIAVKGSVRLDKGKEEKSNVPDKAQEDRPPRTGAELAIILGGNREGVLEAFTIHAIPGYNFKVIRSDFSQEQVNTWVKNAEAEEEEETQNRKAAKYRGNRKNTEVDLNSVSFGSGGKGPSKKKGPPPDDHGDGGEW